MFDINKFIGESITLRGSSFFKEDLGKFHHELSQGIEGKSVLVIGGAGTIGSSFIRALLPFRPSRLFVIDISENGLTELTRDLRSTRGLFIPDGYKTYPLNFSDPILERILKKEGPFDIVANFAAHKHVRSEKDIYSVSALLENNVIRAEQLLRKLTGTPPEHFFCVSTDKAANPVNIMGASKKIMEEVIMAYAGSFQVTTARFANVAFSNGSLLAGHMERIMKKQPLSCPSDIVRYFVSPAESGEICLMACILGNSGEIFFPKLQEAQMMNFKDITLSYLQNLGYQPLICSDEEEARKAASELTDDSVHYPVYFFASDTSGEKPYEEFYTENESIDNSRFHSLGIIKNAPRKSLSEVRQMITALEQAIHSPEVTKEEIVRILGNYLPGFHHIETGKNLDQKM